MRLIIEHIDPARLVPGGIDTCIFDVVRYGDIDSFGIVGITVDPNVQLGVWTTIEFAGKSIQYLPVARFDRRSRARRLRIPHSMRLSLGMLRYNKQLPRRETWQVHRVEVGLTALVFRPSKLIQFIHNDSNGLTGNHSDSSWKGMGRLYRLVERSVLKKCSGVVVFNKTDGPRIRAIRPDVMVAQTWFSPDLFNGRIRDSVLRNGRRTVCWIGRFEAQKDPLLALGVCSELVRSIPELRLILVGDGSLLEALKADVELREILGNVEFSGSLTRPEVAEIMAESDCLLMTSYYEGSPRVLAEAGGVGLPVVATEGADPDGALVDGVNGIRISGRSPRDLAEAVLKASTYSSLDCRRMAEHRSAGPSVARIMSVGQNPDL